MLSAYIPDQHEIEFINDINNKQHEFFEHYCKINNNIDCISLIPMFRESISNGIVPNTRHLGHWDHVGHRIIADSINDYINAKYH